MAITKSDFENLPSSGILDDTRADADAFAVSYAFTYIGYPSLDNFNASFTGKIVLHVLNSAGTIKYVITIEQTYFLLIIPLAPGLVLYTWNQVPTAEKIGGTIGENGPMMSTLGQGNFGVDPAEGSGTTNSEVIVDSRFYSGIFTEPLDEGDRFVIKFHNLSAGFVTAKASLSIATELSASGEAMLFDERIGDRIHVYVNRGGAGKPSIECRRTRQLRGELRELELQYGHGVTVETSKLSDGDNGTVEEDSRLRGLQLMEVEGNALLCVGATGGSPSLLRAFLSLDRGENWGRIMNELLQLVPLCSCILAGQSKVFYYGTGDDKKPAFAILEREGDGFTLTRHGACETSDGSILPTKGVSVDAGEGGALRLFSREASSGVLSAWISLDEGAHWKKEDVN